MRSPISYFGGKSRLSKRIVSMMPDDHVCYCEPFSGAAWVLFAKETSKVEVINDMDNELVTFWRVIQNHLQAFLDYYKYAVVSRHLFNLENKKNPETLTDIQKAARYYYLQSLGFGGKTVKRTWGAGALSPAGLNLSTMEETLLNVHWRLERVTIENMDAIQCIQKYDRKETFFYVDPPYYEVSQCYAHTFCAGDFARLLQTLKTLHGRFILSLNDHPNVRDLFASFNLIKVNVKYSTGNSRVSRNTRSKDRAELLIKNF